MMTDEELAKARKGLAIDTNEDGTPVPLLTSLLSELVVQPTRIANNTDKPTLEITAADAEKAWEAQGMRAYGDRFLDALEALGVKVLE